MALFSSSPPSASANQWSLDSSPFGGKAAGGQPGRLSLQVAGHHQYGGKPSKGELSPSFDATFQSSMNLHEDDDHEPEASGSALDMSPAHPSRHSVQGRTANLSARPPLSKASTVGAFDSAFFKSLTAHQPNPSGPTTHSGPTSRSRTTTSSSSSSTASSRSNSHSDKSRPSINRESSGRPVISALPLADKNFNTLPPPQQPNFFNLLKKNAPGLLRTNSTKVDPLEPSPRPLHLERAKSDLGVVSGRAPLAKENRKPLSLGKESVAQYPPRPTLSSTGASQGRRISGTNRVRSSIPQEWSGNSALPMVRPPPRPASAMSAPIVMPADWGNFSDDNKRNQSEPLVPTRRTIGADLGSRLGREVMTLGSPNGMDVDPCSPQGKANSQRMAVSPGLGDLFEENGHDLSSPAGDAPQAPINRKRELEDPDSSFNSALGSSPVPERHTFGRATGAATASLAGVSSRVIHRATSAASLRPPNARRRGSGLQTFSGSGAHFLGAISAVDQDSSSSRHRKMSRGADGRPTLIKAHSGRRTHSMCDSEFYASPPLDKEVSLNRITVTDYFNSQNDDVEEILHSNMSHSVPSPPAIVQEQPISPERKKKAQLQTYVPSPQASFTSGFGSKEQQGKILPCHPVKEDGLMRITADTLSCLLAGEYDEQIDEYLIVDCRFPYEYAGGHIEGAQNLNTPEAVENFLLKPGQDDGHLYESPQAMPTPSMSGQPAVDGSQKKKTILIFHCEFSAKRAPTLATHLRSKDRAMNHTHYPAVHYPELYVLQGGYAEFYNTQDKRRLAAPGGYVNMDDPAYLAARAADLGEFRKKRIGVRAKSYTFGETTKQIFKNPASSRPIQPAKFLGSSKTKHESLSGAVGGVKAAHMSLNSIINGNTSLSQLSIHDEVNEGSMEQDPDTSTGSPENSFSSTKAGGSAHFAKLADCSSPLGAGAGDSPTALVAGSKKCLFAPTTAKTGSNKSGFPARPSFMSSASSRSSNTAPLSQARPRALFRASTAAALTFGQ